MRWWRSVCASRRAGPTDWHGQQLELRQSSDFDLCILVASEFDSNNTIDKLIFHTRYVRSLSLSIFRRCQYLIKLKVIPSFSNQVDTVIIGQQKLKT